jgi:DNA-binding transcriptional ArsR family regulator
VRVKFVSYLFGPSAGEIINELAAVLDLSDGTVSRYLTPLRNAGLVISDRRAMHVFQRAHSQARRRRVPRRIAHRSAQQAGGFR